MTPVRKTTKKAAEAVKEETKKVTEKAQAEVKKAAETVEKKAEAVKEETKAAAKKTAARGPRKASAKKTAEPAVFVEFSGKQISVKAIAEQVVNVYRDTHKDAAVKSVEVYVKPEENAAYYVVNGEGSPEFRIDL